jgi:predicted phosphodiesterase
MWQGDNIKIGLVSDNHLGSNFAREDVLNMLYDLFENEGIETVLQAGNMVEGEARFNRNELKVWGFDKQCAYAVENYPYRKGITTNFITADDHEGWWAQREGINFGNHIEGMRKVAGMNDFNHLGYLEADIELNGGKFPTEMWLRVVHPGGGSSYATSYSVQKIVESLQPGEKPSILVVGHYHKQLFFPVRGVWTVQPGCTCDQGIYLRKNKIEVALGGAILNITRNSDGLVNRISCEFISVYDKKFYIGKNKYWK